MLIVAPVISGWFGTRMVYEQGVRVHGVSPVENAPDMKMLPGDERVEQYVPSSGPTLR